VTGLACLDPDVFGHCRSSSPHPGYIPIPESVCLSSRRALPPRPPASCQIGRLYTHHPQCPLSPLCLAQYAPTPLQYLSPNAYFLFMFPVHLFWPVVKIRWRAWCARIRTLSLSSAVREAAARKFLDDLCPVGQNPLDFTIVTKAWAGVYTVFSSTNQTLHSPGEILCVVIRLLSVPVFLLQVSMIATTTYILVIHLIPR